MSRSTSYILLVVLCFVIAMGSAFGGMPQASVEANFTSEGASPVPGATPSPFVPAINPRTDRDTPAHLTKLALPPPLPTLNLGPEVVGDGTPASCTAAALEAAIVDGGDISFNCGPDPLIIPGGPYAISADTVINGAGLITLSGETLHRIFEIAPDITLNIADLPLIDGSTNGNGGAILNQGVLIARGILFTNNTAPLGDGGAIYNDSGVVLIQSGAINLTPTFVGNSAINGGALAGNGEWAIYGTVLENNNATAGAGGAMALAAGGELTIFNMTAQFNSAVTGGGAFFFADGSTATLDFVDIFYNTVSGADAQGGGIENNGALTASLLWLGSNAAAMGGGLANGGNATIQTTTFSYNAATTGGGWQNDGTLALENVTISGNTATTGGGATSDGGTSQLRFATWKNNSADSEGTLLVNAGDVTFYASIVNEDTCAIVGGSITSLGYNLQPGLSCNFVSASDQQVDPMLLELASNGGYQPTHLLWGTSAAYDNVPAAPENCVAIDQRMYTRPYSVGCDSGAVEMQAPLVPPTATPTPTRTPTPPVVIPNFSVVDMEVNQGIQDLNDSVPLVAYKRTLVRVYVRHETPGGAPYVVRGQLRITANNTTTTIRARIRPTIRRFLFPINDLIRRSSRDVNVYEFYVPTANLVGNVNFRFTMNPIYCPLPECPNLRDVLETNYNDNVLERNFTFPEVRPLALTLYDVSYPEGGVRYMPSNTDRQLLWSWLLNAYPISRVTYDRDLLVTDLDEVPRTDDLLATMSGIWYLLNAPSDMHYYALVSDGGGFMRGRAAQFGDTPAQEALAEVAVGPVGDPSRYTEFDWDTDDSYGDWYGGHEIGHLLGNYHPQERSGDPPPSTRCGHSSDDPLSHYPNLSISPSYTGDEAIWGWDWHLQDGNDKWLDPVLWTDMMGYCDNQWISDYTYARIRGRIIGGERPAPLPPEALVETDRLLVVGWLAATTDTVSLLPIQVLSDVAARHASLGSDYAIVLYDANATELARYPFDPGPMLDVPTNDPRESDSRHFNELVPLVEGTTQVRIERANGAVLYTVTSGLGVPTVTVESPQNGMAVTGDLTVSWSAQDPDGDPLTYALTYSKDGGETWESAATNLTQTSYTIPSLNLPAGTEPLVRVYASDGIRSGTGDSDPFSVQNHVPVVNLITPAIETTILTSNTLSLNATVSDPDFGTVPTDLITWRSSIDGVVARGMMADITGLSVGNHIISVTVDDGMGGVASDSVLVMVVGDYGQLPTATEDGWAIDPPSLTLTNEQGQDSTTVFIENQATGNAPLQWSVTSDVPWLVLSGGGGTTPAELGVTLDSTGLAPGIYVGTLTFTSPTIEEPYVIQVSAVVQDSTQRLYLPLVQRSATGGRP